MKKGTIYCISGLGADERVFSNLQLNGFELKPVPWLRPHKKEPIEEYAKRMSVVIRDPSPVLLGVSFGGMMGIEIARLLPVKKLIIVSSIKSANEMPQWMKVAGALYLNKLLPVRSYSFTEKIDNNRLGVSTIEEKEMVRDYRKKADPVYLEWAIDKVLNWKNDWQPESLVHIHGDRDKIFPIKNVTANHIVKDGTHLIIYNRATEISKIIVEEMQGTPHSSSSSSPSLV